MPNKVKELRALIYGKYDSEAELARKLGWSRQRLYKITNGLKKPDVQELNDFAQALGSSVAEVADIFLRYQSPNRQFNIA